MDMNMEIEEVLDKHTLACYERGKLTLRDFEWEEEIVRPHVAFDDYTRSNDIPIIDLQPLLLTPHPQHLGKQDVNEPIEILKYLMVALILKIMPKPHLNCMGIIQNLGPFRFILDEYYLYFVKSVVKYGKSFKCARREICIAKILQTYSN